MSSTVDMKAAALWYAEHGIPVFPLHCPTGSGCSCGKPDCDKPGKHPRTAHGFKDATTDPDQVARWWDQWANANIGVPAGTPSGFMVVDIDPRNGGDDSLDKLLFAHGAFPNTAEQITGGGGRHVVFRHPGFPLPKALATGIDLKGDGGYIVVAPSMHVSGNRYCWDGIEGKAALLHPAEPPTWLIDESEKTRAKSKCAGGPTVVGEKWGAGVRNSKLTSVAGSLRRQGLTDDKIAATLMAINAHQCDPPLPDAEVIRIARSVARYPDGPRDLQVSDAWPDPIPFGYFNPDDISPDFLPSWLGDMVRAVALHTETPPGLPGLLSLSIASACVAGKAEVWPEPGYSEPLNLFTCPAMESGNRKTAVLKALMWPLMEWEREAAERIAPQRQRAISERRTLEVRIEKLRRKATDPFAAMQEIQELETKLPTVPVVPRLFTGDCTQERLASLMFEQGGRMAVFSDEGGHSMCLLADTRKAHRT